MCKAAAARLALPSRITMRKTSIWRALGSIMDATYKFCLIRL